MTNVSNELQEIITALKIEIANLKQSLYKNAPVFSLNLESQLLKKEHELKLKQNFLANYQFLMETQANERKVKIEFANQCIEPLLAKAMRLIGMKEMYIGNPTKTGYAAFNTFEAIEKTLQFYEERKKMALDIPEFNFVFYNELNYFITAFEKIKND